MELLTRSNPNKSCYTRARLPTFGEYDLFTCLSVDYSLRYSLFELEVRYKLILEHPCHFQMFNLFCVQQISNPNQYDNIHSELNVNQEEVYFTIKNSFLC